MYFSTVLFLASLVAAAPSYPQLPTEPELRAKSVAVMSKYFDELASDVAAYKLDAAAPSCDLSAVQLPAAPVALPAPSTGLTLKHVAVGRGTQNYTCSSSRSSSRSSNSSTTAPVAVGAVATLFNASCVASAFPDLLQMLPAVALQFDLSDADGLAAAAIGPSDMVVSGRHYFNAGGSPTFELDSSFSASASASSSSSAPAATALGNAVCAKLNATAAPPEATTGRGGEAAVPWLKLKAVEETGDLREVYRVQTAGGSAPATCEGMPEEFNVQYAALYYFYQGPA